MIVLVLAVVMKLKHLLKRLYSSLPAQLCYPFASRFSSYCQQQQRAIVDQWKAWKYAELCPYSSLQEAGFRCYSQFEEDGIILYIMTMLGIHNGTVVEMCCGPGNECMAANLIINHGFKGYLFDGDPLNALRAKSFFSAHKDCLLYGPEIFNEWITAENIDSLLQQNGCPQDVDFFSLDIDGNDYWIWNAIEWMKPKVCCFETHNVIPTDMSLTIPYDPSFNAWISPQPEFRSVSLLAMVKLCEQKGYTLIGGHRHGFNVFFLRNDLLCKPLKAVLPEDVHSNYWTDYSQRMRWPLVQNYPWVQPR